MKAVKKLFMSCNWTNLLYVNFKIDKDIINAMLPKDLEADLFEGDALLSFVGFRFTNARLHGIKIPFHQYFPEINLRTYVRSKINPIEKGIYFISEMVPKFMTYFVGKFFYDEPFTKIGVNEKSDGNLFGYNISDKKNNISMFCHFSMDDIDLQKNREEEFVIDRVFAFCGKNGENSKKYEVRHKKWKLLKISEPVFFFMKI